MNTQYDEREYAVVLTLMKKSDSGYTSQAFPEGTVFLFQGERLQANANNKSVIVPVKRAGTYEVQIETTLSGYECGKYQLNAVLYSASVASYYNSLTTSLLSQTTFTVVPLPTYALSVTAGGVGASQIVSVGENLDITVKASRTAGGSSAGTTTGVGGTADEPDVTVTLYRYQSSSTGNGTYTLVNMETVFTSKESTISADSDGVQWKPVICEGAASGTYRLEFTYGEKGDKKEYLDFIVQ
jgi:hypothetical protein